MILTEASSLLLLIFLPLLAYYIVYITQMEEAEATQQQFQQSQSQKTQYKVVLFHPFQEEYLRTRQRYSNEVADKILQLMRYREQRTYHVIVSDKNEYFGSMWHHLQKQLNAQSPYFEPDLLAMVADRRKNIVDDILEERLEIQFPKIRFGESEQELKQKKLTMLRDQSSQIQRKLLDINESMEQIKGGQQSDSRFKPFQIKQEKLKQYEQFIKRQKKEKQQRGRLLQQQRKKEQQLKLKKQQEQKEVKEKLMKQRKEELLKKVKQNQEKRQKEKQERQLRDKDYKFISKSLAQQPPLFKKLQQSYYHRYEKNQLQNRKKVMSERHSMFQAVDTKALEEHQKRYEDLRAQKERQRRERLEDYERMIEMQQEQLQSKYRSSYDIKTTYVDKRAEQRKMALQKKERMKHFIEQTVKQRYLPRIDEQKRKQFMKIIQNLQKNKKLKKVKREDGSVQYQEIKVGDPRMVGLQYLQLTKQMAAKMRGKRKNSDNVPTIQNQKPRVIDYLAQQRKKGSSKSHRDRLQFVSRKGLSFDQKLKKVQFQSQKLQQLAKQKQMKLKFGKFSTSDQILQHKQEIDQHYIDIINMKLKLINQE